MLGVDDSPYQWCGESTTSRIGDTGSFQKIFRQRLPESSIRRVGDSPYHWYAELSTPRITDTRSRRLPDSLMLGVVDSPYHRCGEHIIIAIFPGTKDACNNRQFWRYFFPIVEILTGRFFGFFYICTVFNTASFAAPQIVSEDAGIEPRTVATLALTVWSSNHSARSHPLIG
jgi:hypothetical protein